MAKNDTQIPAATAGMPEGKPSGTVASNRQRLVDRFSGNEGYQDDDEYMYGAAADALDEADNARAERDAFNKAVAGSDIAPEMMGGLLSGKNEDGTDFNLEDYLFTKNIDFFIDYLENSETARGKMDARRKERQDAEAKAEQWLKERSQKIEAEDKELEKAALDMGYKTEQIADLISWIYGKKDKDGNPDGSGFIDRAMSFDLKADDFKRLFQIKDYDVKVAEADNAGYVRGKNERIDAFKRKDTNRKNMPADMTGGGAGTPREQKKDPRLAALDRMKNAY